MASPTRLLGIDLPSPDSPGGMQVTMIGLQRWLERRPNETLESWQTRLTGHLATINGQLQAQTAETMRILAASPPLSDSTSQLDRIVPRSTPMESQPGSSMDRGGARSEGSPQPSQAGRGPWAERFGPRVAARLAASQTRKGG